MASSDKKPYVRLTPLNDLKKGKSRLRILLIGVNDYQDTQEDFRSLSFPVKDCEDLAKAFTTVTSEFRDSDQNCTTRIISLLGVAQSQLTVQSVENARDELLQGLDPKDTVIFYFAGHGKIDEQTGKFYLCLPNTLAHDLARTGLDIQLFLNSFKDAGVKKQIVLLDACHSAAGNLTARNRGAAVALPRSTLDPIDASQQPDLSSKLQGIVQEFATSAWDFYAILSCAASQQAWECPLLQHGVFTHYLIQGLLQEAETGTNGELLTQKLREYVRDKTAWYCYEFLQQVQEPAATSHGQGDALVLGSRSPLQKLPQGPDLSPPGSTRAIPRESKAQYIREVWQTLTQQYPNYPHDPAICSQFENVWRRQFSILSNKDLSNIAQETIAEFEEYLSHYKAQAMTLLFTTYPHATAIFEDLRQEFELGATVVERQEQQALELFNQQKANYHIRVFEVLHEFDETDLASGFSLAITTQLQALQAGFEAELRELKIEPSMDEIMPALNSEALAAIAQRYVQYRDCCSRCLRQPSWEHEQERAELEQDLKEHYRFPEDKLRKIYCEIEVAVHRDEETYESEYIRLLQQDTHD